MNMHTTPEADTEATAGALPIPRATILEIERNRTRALELYAQAFDTLQQAGTFAKLAAISRGHDASNLRTDDRQLLQCYAPNAAADGRARFLGAITMQVDRAVWGHLIEATDLERLMDKTARDEFRESLRESPPPATAANCYATLQQLLGDADMIFRRGIAKAFSQLDRRFRSHDGFKIGARIVLANMMDSGPFGGGWNYHARREETLRDVERVFSILDGSEQGERAAGIVGAIEAKREELRKAGGWGPSSYTAESPFFEVRIFKNGNAHVWFKRKDLVQRVNLLLAEHYGAALGEGAEQASTTAAPAAKRSMARNFGLFETSRETAEFVMRRGGIEAIRPQTRILEPSAGRGALLEAMREAGGLLSQMTAVEVQPDLSSTLRAGRVVCRDFLDCTPAQLGRFDLIFMNPPFDLGRDCDHVRHALQFLAPGGVLVAIMAAGVEFREDARTVRFRAEVDRYPAAERYGCGKWHDLPPGSFAHAGTMVNTVALTIRAPSA